MKSIRQRNLKLTLGQPLNQTIYNERGQVLLSEGQMIPSHEALQKIYQIGYVLHDAPTVTMPKKDFFENLNEKNIDHTKPFDILFMLQNELKTIYDQAPFSFKDPEHWQLQVNWLILFLNHLCEKYKHQIIGLYQLYALESTWHHKILQGTILIKMLAASYWYSPTIQSWIMAIFLTKDIGMPHEIHQWEQQKRSPNDRTMGPYSITSLCGI